MWWGNRCGSITTNLKGNWKQIGTLPDLPDNYAFNTMYPLTATISPLAYDPKKNYAAGMVIFGGGGQVSKTRVSDVCISVCEAPNEFGTGTSCRGGQVRAARQ